MSRPTPRKSSLAGANPVTPPVTLPAQPEPPAAAKRPTKVKYPPKVSFYQDPTDTARMRGAILHTQVTEGPRSLSQFVAQAVMEKVEALEAQYNNGEPFPPIGARELPQGRPMGE